MLSTDTKPELTAKASMAQPVSQPAVYANGLKTVLTFSFHLQLDFPNISSPEGTQPHKQHSAPHVYTIFRPWEIFYVST
jgi:hypothetical protein